MSLRHPDPTIRRFLRLHARSSAANTLTRGQNLRYQCGLLLLLVAFLYDWKMLAAGLMFAVCGFYVFIILYRLFCILVSLVFDPDIKITPEELAAARDEDLPVYTILLPMYKENNIAQKIIHNINTLDYPHDKLDVKLLLERDDEETIAACNQLQLMLPYLEVFILADAKPKTKPKACNHGLYDAKGEFLVIYDAEDRPDKDQLKKAVLAFRKLPERVVCLQAKLNYYNSRFNWLTKMFTMEYSAWFDLLLPGLQLLGVPIPLGGTSNHFRTAVLRKVGGWDPFNLTEDCDLGMRLHILDKRTCTLDSTTLEEANSQVPNWIRQRSRWVKGYVQTHFAHARSNLHTLWRLGLKGYLSFLLTVGGNSLCILLNPIFWAVGLAWLGLYCAQQAGWGPGPWQVLYADRVSDLPDSPLTVWSQLSQVFYYATVALLVANAFFILINVIACIKRRLWGILPYTLLSPFYWLLISIAGWKGTLQLLSRPFYWEKTVHGLTGAEDAPAPSPAAP